MKLEQAVSNKKLTLVEKKSTSHTANILGRTLKRF
jgi:hypothetical protein